MAHRNGTSANPAAAQWNESNDSDRGWRIFAIFLASAASVFLIANWMSALSGS